MDLSPSKWFRSNDWSGENDQKFGQAGFGKRHFQCQIPSPQSFTEVPVLEKAGNIYGFEYTKVERHLKKPLPLQPNFHFCVTWLSPQTRDTDVYSDGSRPENPSTGSKAGTSLQSDTEEHEVWGWEWLGCCTDRKTLCVCSFGLKVTVRGRGINKKTSQKKEGRKPLSWRPDRKPHPKIRFRIGESS